MWDGNGTIVVQTYRDTDHVRTMSQAWIMDVCKDTWITEWKEWTHCAGMRTQVVGWLMRPRLESPRR